MLWVFERNLAAGVQSILQLQHFLFYFFRLRQFRKMFACFHQFITSFFNDLFCETLKSEGTLKCLVIIIPKGPDFIVR